MKFISLIDSHNRNIITIEVDSLRLRLEIDDIVKEVRVKPFMASILYEIFYNHPNPLIYDEINKILREHHLIVSDSTRMHRKLSETRQVLEKLHPSLKGFIINNRATAYSLPLKIKKLCQIENQIDNIKFTNAKISNFIKILEFLINGSIIMTSQSKIIKHSEGYIIDRNPVKQDLLEKIAIFDECQKNILKEICMHDAEFISLRINCFFAKLKTYIGLARISEYPISQIQWLDWFKQEIWTLFEELKKLIKLTEII